MVSIAICDDNAVFVEELAEKAGELLRAEHIDHTLAKYLSGAQLLTADPHDIVLLDVAMGPMDGMEAARRLRERGDACRIVFLSAHRQYVFEAFDVEAAHYLTKPVDENKLREVLLRLARAVQGESRRYLTLRQGGALRRVPLGGILYLEVYDRKVLVHTTGGTEEVYDRLDRLERELPDGFFRCHRSYLVHFAHVRRYDKTEVTLSDGARIPLARRKYPPFCKAFLGYLRREGEL